MFLDLDALAGTRKHVNILFFHIVDNEGAMSNVKINRDSIDEGLQYLQDLETADNSRGYRKYKKICFGCGKLSNSKIKICSGCNKIYYCNRECQKRDWKNHKAICKTIQKHES